MENRYDIQVKFNDVWYYLDTYKYDPVSLQFQISDINEIDKRRSSYSKTITLPMTKHNRQLLGDITNPAVVSNINPNKKAECWILVNTIPVLQGTLQIINSSYEDIMNKESIEVVVYSDNDDLFKTLGEKYLTDLDLSYMTHTYSTANVVASWSETVDTLGYYYPLIDYGKDFSRSSITIGSSTVVPGTGIVTKDYFPAPYVKAVWDKIFYEAGYTYKSNFLNSETFKRLILPFCRDKAHSDINNYDYDCYVSRGSTYSSSYTTLEDWYSFEDIVRLDNEVYDPNNLWNPTTFQYTVPGTQVIKMRFNLRLQIRMLNTFVSDVTALSVFLTNEISPGITDGVNINDDNLPVELNPNTAPFAVQITSDATWTTYDAWVVTDFENYNPGNKITAHIAFWVPPNYSGVTYELTKNSYFFTEVSDDLQQGYPIDMNRVLSQNVKQKDFLTSIIKMFNLYVEPDPTEPRSLYIEPRDDYYNSGTIEDWTSKLDIGEAIDEEILSNTQYRTILATYKDDTDYFNQTYKQNTNNIYGQYREEIDNDFINGDKKIEIIFSPTPLVNMTGMNDFIIPKIVKYESGAFKSTAGDSGITSANIRILTRCKDGLLTLKNTNDAYKFQGNATYSYPYAGHLDDPYQPDYDINFGLVDGLFGFSTDMSNSTLIETYWRNQFDEFNDKDSKIVTCDVYLNESDIYNFRFNKKIFLKIKGNGQYYRVLNITDYYPGIKKTSKVKLLKIKDITVPVKRRTPRKTTGESLSSSSFFSGSSRVLAGRNIALGDYSVITNEKNLLIGDYSSAQGSRSIIVGDYSIMSGNNTKSSMILGDYNTIGVSSSYIDIKGLSNSIPSDAVNLSISGSNNMLNFGFTGSSYSSAFINAMTIVGDDNKIGWTNKNIGTQSLRYNLDYVNVYGENNDIGLSSSYLNVFGFSNSVGNNVKNLDVKGDNNVIADGLENVIIFGNNQTVTTSNTTLISNPITTNVSGYVTNENYLIYQSTTAAAYSYQITPSGTWTNLMVNIYVTGHQTTAPYKVYFDQAWAAFLKSGGSTTQIGSTTQDIKKQFTGTAFVDILDDGTNVFIRIVGEASTTIDWKIQYELRYV